MQGSIIYICSRALSHTHRQQRTPLRRARARGGGGVTSTHVLNWMKQVQALNCACAFIRRTQVSKSSAPINIGNYRRRSLIEGTAIAHIRTLSLNMNPHCSGSAGKNKIAQNKSFVITCSIGTKLDVFYPPRARVATRRAARVQVAHKAAFYKSHNDN